MRNNYILACALLCFPAALFSQTGGPGQPEFMQFQQAGTSGLVSPSSGSFTYQIPLFSIGGYPMNLTYQSGIQMEDVASATGLGWNINAGAIVRTLRVLPDDFDGDPITKEYSVKPNETYGGKVEVDMEIAGLPIDLMLSAGLGVFYNNYKGWGLEPSLGGSVGVSAQASSGVGGSASLGMGVSVNSQSGVDRYISPSVGLKLGKGNDKLSISLGKTWSVNSNEGLQTSVNAGLSYVRRSEGKNGERKDADKKGKTKGQDSYSASLLGYANRSYLNNSFQPDIDYPFENLSGTYSGTIGGDGYYIDPSARVTGYFSIQRLATKLQVFAGLGILYDRPGVDGKTLQDFNREKKLPYFIGESKILPIPFRTPDIFNLNAQGLSMTFSLSKNDVGVVGDARGMVSTSGMNIGAEVNLGNLFKAGGNVGTITSTQTTGRWNPTYLDFVPGQGVLGAGEGVYQQEYLRNHGEINLFDNSLFTTLGRYSPVNFPVTSESSVGAQLNNGGAIGSNLTNTSQPVRQSAIAYLTASEAAASGFDRLITYFSFGNTPSSELRSGGFRKDHHISEISVTQPDGMKYVFGLPVYNIKQKDATFNVGANPNEDCARNTVTYQPGVDNSTSNTRGIDHFFESTTTPAYVTQFLITAVLNPDYRDLTNNGISDDDLGNYVRFTYYKEAAPYNWRTPTGLNQATFNRSVRSDLEDDKGTYLYGEKELYYLRTVESKTEVAEYHYSERTDGQGVIDENGGIDPARLLRKLDSIRIFSLPDRRRNGNSAIPIKTVHFTYDYSLCVGIDNGPPNTGKLTLRQVAFTYEESLKGKLTPYLFDYGNRTATDKVNPPYNIRNVNRWGYFQENAAGAYSDCSGTGLSNIDAPYASQDRSVMDANAYAWNLTDITIPGGGKLRVDYEAHDYSYLQDKVPGRMFQITGLSDATSGNELYAGMTTDYPRVYFKLDAPITSSNPKAELKKKYIRDLDSRYLYYKVYVELIPGRSEYVTGYAKVKDYDIAGNNQYAWIELEKADLDDDHNNGSCSPILKSALQYMRINRNALIFSSFPGAPGGFGSFIQQVPNVMSQLGAQISASAMGVNKYCRTQGHCRTVDLSKSFIRLYEPDGSKTAGGSRVRAIAINDQWDAMAGNTHEGKSYTTTYDYTTTENGTPISSGVAEYEPLVGGDEISLKQPIFYSDVKKLAPDNDFYVEEPVNESLFPAPQIIYGKVTQTTNSTAPAGSIGTPTFAKTGRIVNEFHTARDYPVKVSRTTIDEKRDKSKFSPIQPPFVAIDKQHDFATVSQGYSIELNNMSGLAKATWVYNENGDRISGEVSEYFLDNENFTTLDRFGRIFKNTRLGLTAEYTVDGRRSYDKSVNNVFKANLNMAIFGIFPIPIVMPLYSKMTEEKQFQSIVVNKVIHRDALLKRKIVYEQSASISTENLAFDRVTGEALLTKTTNEFNDTLYSFKYPAYWMYGGMGPAYRNTRVEVSPANIASVAQVLQEGDELRGASTPNRLWVKSTSPVVFVDESGAQRSLAGSYLVYNPAAKNLLSSKAGEVVTWNRNPIENVPALNFGTGRILNSSATEYQEKGVAYCDSCRILADRKRKNDYLSGRRGNWKPSRSWFHLTERTPTSLPTSATDIRTQGLFATYQEFWRMDYDTGSQYWPNPQQWEWKEKVNLRDVDGQTIETEDRIGRRVASLLGYRNTLVTAQAQNAGYSEAYFDGFEDYFGAFCPYVPAQPASVGGGGNALMKRLNRISGPLVITPDKSHTGRYSLRVSEPLTFGVMPPVICRTSPDIRLDVRPDSIRHRLPNGDDRLLELRDSALPPPRVEPPVNRSRVPAPANGRGGSRVPVTGNIRRDTNCTECAGGFYPERNKKYLFSCWVRVEKPEPILSSSDASIEIYGATTVVLHPEGPVIEGWQRVMGEFTTPANVANLIFRLKAGSAITYYDDIRILPADGNMISYVYDDVNLRLTYSLDENNYYTKNEYNNQGELIRTKRETERGIFTIREGNQGLVKTQ